MFKYFSIHFYEKWQPYSFNFLFIILLYVTCKGKIFAQDLKADSGNPRNLHKSIALIETNRLIYHMTMGLVFL
jgi:hypothetical protein